jgi:hypothetical protein
VTSVRWAFFLGALGLLCAPGARAHIVVGSKTVHTLVAESDCVVRARVVAAHGVAARSSDRPGRDRPAVDADVVEALKGPCTPGRLRFVQHGHGVATFEPGREHLLFLVGLARHPELDELAGADGARWVSLQEHDDAHPLDGPEAPALLEATRAYVRAGAATDPAARASALRAATLRLLGSGDAGLAASALRDQVAAPGEPFLTEADAPALMAIVDDPATAMGVRVALLGTVERRGFVDGRSRWLAWLADDAPPANRVLAIRAAGRDTRPEIRARLIALLASDRPADAAAAASALGRAGDASVVPPLAAALDHPASRVRQSAIRSLGQTRTPAALAALDAAAADHPDPVTRRLAAAEAKKRRVAEARP